MHEYGTGRPGEPVPLARFSAPLGSRSDPGFDLAVSGQLNPQMYGPSMYPYVPEAALQGHSDPDKIWKPFDEEDASRRTIYAFIKRSLLVPLLEVLDFCDTARTAASRQVTSVAPRL